MVVVILSDANLATSQQPFPRPQFSEAWLAPPIDQSAVPAGAKPYDWDETTGLARRFIPGQPGGMHTLTGLAHDRQPRRLRSGEQRKSHSRPQPQARRAAEDADDRRRCSATDKGDLLVIGWGSTKGAIEEAVDEPARRGPQGVVAASAVPAADGARHQGDHAALQEGDHHREQLVRRSRTTRSSTRPIAAIRRSPCCCARATSSTSIAGARSAASRSSPSTIRRVLRAETRSSRRTRP